MSVRRALLAAGLVIGGREPPSFANLVLRLLLDNGGTGASSGGSCQPVPSVRKTVRGRLHQDGHQAVPAVRKTVRSG